MSNLIEILKTSLLGKKVKHMNQYRREVILEVEDVKIEHHTRQITPDTKENDWWGESESWDTITVSFVDGSKKEFGLNEKIEIIN